MIKELILQGNLTSLKEMLIEKGVEYVKNNTTPSELSSLHWAAGAGRIEIVQFFLDLPIQEDPNISRMNNAVPLHTAAIQGHSDIIDLLIARGAAVNVQTAPQRYAPIHSAAFGGHLESVKALVAAGANIHLQNYRGEYPKDTAKRQKQTAVIQYLEAIEEKENNNLERVQNGLLELLNQLSTQEQTTENYNNAINDYLTNCIRQDLIKEGTASVLVAQDNEQTGQFNVELKVLPNTPKKAFVLELNNDNV